METKLIKQVITKILLKEVYFNMTSREVDDGYVLAFRNPDHPEKITSQGLNNKPLSYDKNEFLLKIANDLKSPLQ